MSNEIEETTQPEPEKPTPAPPTPISELEEVIVREYPKTILFYPMLFISLILALTNWVLGITVLPLNPTLYWNLTYTLTFIWFFLFFFNLLVVTFEFGKNVIVILALIIVVIILVAALFLTLYGFVPLMNPALLNLYVNFNSLLAFVLIFLFVIFMAWIKTRIYYFRITPNEIIYKKGIMGDVERYGTTNVMVHKEIRDVFEYLLFRSGRLTFTIPGRKTAIVLDNIPNINNVETKILYLLRRIDVDID